VRYLVNCFRIIEGFGCAIGATLALSVASSSASAQFLSQEHVVDRDEIRIGMINAHGNSPKQSGWDFQQGYLAYFSGINHEGGIFGRQIHLVNYDDHYKPLETIFYTERLINSDRVFALVGYIGTAASTAASSMSSEAGMIFLGPKTGAESLRNPVLPLVFNVRASYADEIETLVDYLVGTLDLKRIAVVRQNDGFGDDGIKWLNRALESRQLQPVADSMFVRNSTDMQPALEQITPFHPQAVIIMGTFRPIVSLLKRAQSSGIHDILFCALSTVSASAVVDTVGEGSEGMILSQVVPWPEDTSIPVVRSFQSDMRAIGVDAFSHGSLEAYLGAILLVDAIRRAGPDLTEQRCVEALNQTNLDLQRLRIAWNQKDHSGSHAVFLTRVKNGKLEPIEEKRLTSGQH
jgi:ABC-type branched-subunit amino acid transport system substrate-binding protein